MRRLSMVLQAPQGGSPQDKSQNSIGSCSDFSGMVVWAEGVVVQAVAVRKGEVWLGAKLESDNNITC
jgi:hypothetical protein